jgi:drug/metabolite transporter (DMT)-like permease
MKSFLKISGLLLILIGALILVVCSYTGNVNSNGILLLATILVIGGLISYIVINKRIY